MGIVTTWTLSIFRSICNFRLVFCCFHYGWHLPWEDPILSHHGKGGVLPAAASQTCFIGFVWYYNSAKKSLINYYSTKL